MLLRILTHTRGTANANGPNWIEYLATAHNQSNIRVVNLSNGGATVDTALVAPFTDSVLSLKQQVEDDYLPHYSNTTEKIPWDRSNTLFVFWMGLNDVARTEPKSTLYTEIFEVYSSLLERVYKSGARNILLMNAPPVDKAPEIVQQGPALVLSRAAGVADFNKRLSSMAAKLTKAHKDAKVFLFDSGFSKIMSDPCSFPQTCSIKFNETTCEAYLGGKPDWALNTTSLNCGVPIDGYFWLNALHPTTIVHNATAQYIADQLTAASPCYRR